ncbi:MULTISPECIES: hypothetical protein [unclassified Neglectibacter]|uniref:hypothetical protein n=1 Tax=unclassified Neglectibacter TaxID=2632164 RepID=UPI001367A0C7|nr:MULTISPECIES: hypothetical protein [unclassified Neglectibacter]MCI9115833.1 hypothetical protein [Acutalibacter sp.]
MEIYVLLSHQAKEKNKLRTCIHNRNCQLSENFGASQGGFSRACWRVAKNLTQNGFKKGRSDGGYRLWNTGSQIKIPKKTVKSFLRYFA